MPIHFGRYVVEDEVRDRLGQGAFGLVYRAVDPKLNRRVAIKVLRPDAQVEAADAERFFREARALATLQHPGIVPVFDFGDENGVFYLVLAFFAGGTLQGRLQERLKAGQGPFSAAETLSLLEPICGGLSAAHRHGMIHRDLKPANILLDEDGHPAISDFGLVHLLNEGSGPVLTQRGDVMGTPAYMAPEQWEPELRQVTAQTDLYALGCVVHCLLTGQAPFQGSAPVLQARHLSAPPPKPSAARPELAPAWDDAVGCLLAKDAEARFPTADAFLDWLKLALDDATVRLPAHLAPAAATAEGPAGTPEESSLGRATTVRPPRSPAPENTQLAAASTIRGARAAEPAEPFSPRWPLVATVGAALVALGLWLGWPKRAAAPARPPSVSAPLSVGGANTLGHKFVNVPLADGTSVEFAVLETRRSDFQAYVEDRQSGAWTDATPLPPTTLPNWREPGFPQAADHPVVYVSWDDASAFCRWLTARERQSGALPANRVYRLPTNAEWSAAAGPSTFPWRWTAPSPARDGEEWEPPQLSGNFKTLPEWVWKDGAEFTMAAGSYNANFLGLHDLAGNVHEWCLEVAAEGRPERSIRGGSYNVHARAALRTAQLSGQLPTYRDAATGFRLVRAAVR